LEAKLQGADLSGANLQRAVLLEAKLQGTNFWRANLQEAALRQAEFDENTILSDRSHWTPATDMTRFTQPDNAAETPSNDQSH
jgi:uncharacterized protein YjbI with pentapeptide repeats